MMGLYIPNEKMPGRCEDCLLCHVYETPTAIACGCIVNMRTREIGCVTRPDWCPLIDLGEHGDLVDRDTILQQMENPIHSMMVFGGHIVYSEDAIKKAPVIIPAEGNGK